MEFTIQAERLAAAEYIEFLKHTDLGSQYPRERFEARVEKLVRNASISLTARDSAGALSGVCFGITDFAYWLFITDLGVIPALARGLGGRWWKRPWKQPAAKRTLYCTPAPMKTPSPFMKSWEWKKQMTL